MVNCCSTPSEDVIKNTSEKAKWSCMRKCLAVIFSQLGMLVFIIVYLIAGTYIFNYLEQGNHQQKLKMGIQNLAEVVQTVSTNEKFNETVLVPPQPNFMKISIYIGMHSVKLQLAGIINELDSNNVRRKMIQNVYSLLSNKAIEEIPEKSVLLKLWKISNINLTKQIANIDFMLRSYKTDLDEIITPYKQPKGEPKLTINIIIRRVYEAIKAGWKPPFIDEGFNELNLAFDLAPSNFSVIRNVSALSVNGITDDPWSYSGSLFFAITVITTIGYGNIVPKTTAGRLATIFYGLFGIPIMLLFLANLGKLMADIFRLMYKRLTNCCKPQKPNQKQLLPNSRSSLPPTATSSCTNTPKLKPRHHGSLETINKNPSAVSSPSPSLRSTPGRVKKIKNVSLHASTLRELVRRTSRPPMTNSIFVSLAGTNSFFYKAMKVRQESRNIHIPIWLSLIIIVFYIIVGSLVFAYWEEWPFSDAMYFVFVTISTIGFGDMIPGIEDMDSERRGRKFVFATIYLLVGLAMVCMCFDLMQLEIRRWSKKLAKRIGLIDKKK